jgi:UDPglucose 6-dehydrogenase
MNNLKITVVGSGYVGMSLSVLLAQHNHVTVLDINPERVSKVNKLESTVSDNEIESFLSDRTLFLKATLIKEEAYKDADFIIIATPTDYDEINNSFDTSSVDSVIADALNMNADAMLVIKSTIPVGHTKSLQEKYSTNRIIFSPEFSREGMALKDNLYPSRIIVGGECNKSLLLSQLLKDSSKKNDVQCLHMDSTEAEAVKLFSNSFLAMRVAFFNELDTYAETLGLDSKQMINGIGLDPRIGEHYNNPSFGYGGYCLPKDTQQLVANFRGIPQDLIKSIVDSNETRKNFIANVIIKKNPKVVGIYRLIMKSGSDNFRSSSIQGIMSRLKNNNIEVVVFEPELLEDKFFGFNVINNLTKFKSESDIIISNRKSEDLDDVMNKVYTRDIYGTDS